MLQLHLNYALFSSMKECRNHYFLHKPFLFAHSSHDIVRSLIIGSGVTWSKLMEWNPTAWLFHPASAERQLVLVNEAKIIFLRVLVIFSVYFNIYDFGRKVNVCFFR